MSHVYVVNVRGKLPPKKPAAPSMSRPKSYVDKRKTPPDKRSLFMRTQMTPDEKWICRVYVFGRGEAPIWCSPKRDTFLGCCREVNEWMEGKSGTENNG